MNIFSWLPRKKSTNKKVSKKIIKKSDRKILVISGGGFRGVYALGVLKAIEENHIDKEIDAVYGVSIGAIIGSLWTNGMKADEIFKLMSSISLKDFYGKDMLGLSGGFVSNKNFAQMIDQYLPKTFEDLQLPLYIGAVDTNTAEYILFHSGELHKAVLGSMSIPGFFPPVKFGDYSLVDGGVLNNFPVDIAKKHYPDHKIIGISLNKFQTNQKIKTALDNLQITFEVIMRSKLQANTKLTDYLFCRDLPISILSLNKKQMHEAFALGYEDGIKMFSKRSIK